MVEIGIHTFSLFHKLSYSDVQNLIELLQEQGHCRKIKDDVYSGNRAYFSDYFSQYGVLIYLYQHLNGRSGISLRVTPCTALEGQYAATSLYQPTKKNYRKLTDILDRMLDELELDFTSEDMTISRADPCANLQLDESDLVAEYLRIFRKARVIRHYKVVTYQKSAKSVKNAKEANQHSYRQQSRRASFTAYDKRYVLQQLDRCPNDLTDKGILRIEAELQREALLKRIKAKKGWSNEKILKESAKRSAQILSKYLCQLLGAGDYMRYQDAVALIESAKMKKKMRERMIYLLRKTSDSNNLDRALAKLQKKYNLKESQANRVLKKFQRLGISPITLQNRSESNALPSILSALD